MDGVAAYKGDDPPAAMPFFQDFAHQEVRDSRLEITLEACERYDIDGYHYDFMRYPRLLPHRGGARQRPPDDGPDPPHTRRAGSDR